MENRCRTILLFSQFLLYKHGITTDYKTQLHVQDVLVLHTAWATVGGVVNTKARIVTKKNCKREICFTVTENVNI
jgi:hypothetical protein